MASGAFWLQYCPVPSGRQETRVMDKKSNFQWLTIWPGEHGFDQFKQEKGKKHAMVCFFQSPQMKVSSLLLSI